MSLTETLLDLPLTALPALPWALGAAAAALRFSALRGRALAVLIPAVPFLWASLAQVLGRSLPGSGWLNHGYAIEPQAWWVALAWLALTCAPQEPSPKLNPRGVVALIALPPFGFGAALLAVILAGRGQLERGRVQPGLVIAALLLMASAVVDTWSLQTWGVLTGPSVGMSWDGASLVIDGGTFALQAAAWCVALPWALSGVGRGVRSAPLRDTLPARSPNSDAP